MQAANVHAVLEGGPMVASVLQRAGEAVNSVDDLAESLAIFDLKLRHMREVCLSSMFYRSAIVRGQSPP